MIESEGIGLKKFRQLKDKSSTEPVHNYFHVPADFSVLACRKRCFKQTKFFFWLKFNYGGRCKVNAELIQFASHSLRVSHKTIQRYLKFLIRMRWTGFNKTNDLLYMRGFDCIRRNEGLQTRRAYLFKYEDLDLTKEFLIASAISIWARRKIYSLKESNRVNRGLIQEVGHFKRNSPAFVALSNIEISEYLETSLSNASNWKNLVVSEKLMLRERSFEDINLKSPCTREKLWLIEQYRPDWKGKLRLDGAGLLLQHSDKMRSELIASRRNKVNLISDPILHPQMSRK